jgi:hypothetical protein
MTKELTVAEHEAIEALIDRYNLAAVLEAVADVCEDKAQHIRENWQDEPTSRLWQYASRKVQATAVTFPIKDVSE